MMVVDGVEVLDVREAAAYADRTPETIRRWVWAGRLPARRQGNRLLVARRDLQSLVTPVAATPLTLTTWEQLLPAGTAGSAADLVLADRSARDSGRHAGR